jgi:hypothetical protein
MLCQSGLGGSPRLIAGCRAASLGYLRDARAARVATITAPEVPWGHLMAENLPMTAMRRWFGNAMYFII